MSGHPLGQGGEIWEKVNYNLLYEGVAWVIKSLK